MGGRLIFKIVLIWELNFSYNPVLTAFESYGIFEFVWYNSNYLIWWKDFHYFFEWIANFVWRPDDVYWIIMKIFWFNVATSSFSRSLTPFIPGMIDVRCTNELIGLWWMNMDFGILYSVFKIKNMPRFIANLRIWRISSNLKKKQVLSILP